MSRAKPPRRKAYRHRPAGARTLRTQPWKLRSVFQPLEDILNQMEATGFSDADQRGTPIFQSMKDSCWYTSAPAINGVADAYALHEKRSGRPMPTEPLRRVANKLHYGSMVFASDLADMRAALATLRTETMDMTEDYAHSLLQTVCIQVELERNAA
ncbi:hypothetical protein [Herminiimonas sp. CN]|uniref:hypothetical protein n=1 Tax=Herminiimonas sp. CN TaxID=1349818 RepID=UPI000473644A|nr:hypothetical protein [Herminiimonas sp. CN]